MTSKPVSPFFKSGAPPPALPLLTCQTNFSYITLPVPTITVREEVSTRSTVKKHSGSSLLHRARSALPYTRPLPKSKANNITFPVIPAKILEDDSQSESAMLALTELCESLEIASRSPSPPNPRSCSPSSGESDDEDLIKPPPGQAAHPGTGGYTLDKALVDLKWKKQEVEKLRTLDLYKSYSNQDHIKKQNIYMMVTAEFPRLSRYKNCWPVKDLMVLRLKNTSSRAKRRAIADRVKMAAVKAAVEKATTEVGKKRSKHL